MEIIPGRIDHIPACLEIARSVALQDGSSAQHGFLLSGGTDESYRELFDDAIVRLAVLDGEVAGFLSVTDKSSSHFQELITALATVQWQSPLNLGRPDLFYIDKIAVHPKYHRRGVAKALYAQVFGEFSDAHFFTALVEKPLRNEASEHFHLKLDFKRIGTFAAADCFGFDQYQSGIYSRD